MPGLNSINLPQRSSIARLLSGAALTQVIWDGPLPGIGKVTGVDGPVPVKCARRVIARLRVLRIHRGSIHVLFVEYHPHKFQSDIHTIVEIVGTALEDRLYLTR